MARRIRVAILGAGYWGSNLIRLFHTVDGFILQTVCDVRAELLPGIKSRFPDISVETLPENILRDPALDAVVVATPPASHFALAQAALRAGKHVWVEKPFALRYADGQRLVALAREQQLALFVDETFLYDPLIQQVRARLAADEIGAVHHVSLERTGMGRIRRDSNVWWNSAPHDVSILRYVLDARVSEVAVTGHAFVQPGIEDVIWASLRMEHGVSAHVYLHWLFPEKKAPMMIVGERGMLGYEGRFEKRSLRRYAYHLGATDSEAADRTNILAIEHSEVVEEVLGDRTEPLAAACIAFRETILTGETVPSSGEYALHTLAVLEAGAQSLAQNGAWIEVADEDSKG